jgi:hypothetical protein
MYRLRGDFDRCKMNGNSIMYNNGHKAIDTMNMIHNKSMILLYSKKAIPGVWSRWDKWFVKTWVH